MIELGEPLHYFGTLFFSILLAFFIGTQFGSLSKKAQKNDD